MFDTLSPKQIQQNLSTSARQAWLASLGAVASIEEEGSQLIDDLVERGREIQTDRRRKIEKTVEEAGDKIGSTIDQISSRLDQRLAAGLQQLGVPSRSEIRELTRKVERLTLVVDRLAARQEAPQPQRRVYHVTPHEDGWKVQAESAERASRLTDTKAEAVAVARELANNQEPSQVVIHRLDGTIQTHYTYGEVE